MPVPIRSELGIYEVVTLWCYCRERGVPLYLLTFAPPVRDSTGHLAFIWGHTGESVRGTRWMTAYFVV